MPAFTGLVAIPPTKQKQALDIASYNASQSLRTGQVSSDSQSPATPSATR